MQQSKEGTYKRYGTDVLYKERYKVGCNNDSTTETWKYTVLHNFTGDDTTR